MKKYDLYFHSDFDGLASAAVVLDFLRSHGEGAEHFTPLNYEIVSQWKRADFFRRHKLFKGKHNPAIVVDFLYHPKAAFWFDHHPTTFNAFPSFARRFKRRKPLRQAGGGIHYWEPEYFSCCREVAETLQKHFGYRPPRHIRELAKWLDVIDHAQYVSPSQPIEMREPALQIDWYVEVSRGEAAFAARLVQLLAERPLEEISRRKEVRAGVSKIRKKIRESLAFYRRALDVRRRVAFMDLTRAKCLRLRFAPYYFQPELSYAISLLRDKKIFRLSWGSNPWRRPKDGIHIGEFLRRYGGGGHAVAGGAEFRTHADGLKAVEEIMEYINSRA